MSDGDGSKAVDTPSAERNSVSFRENLIATAVSFLQNSKVKNSPLFQKKAFLAHKGLTSEEIDIAIERSGILKEQDIGPQENILVTPKGPQHSSWTKWKEIWSSFVIFGVTFYGAYTLYKHYIEPKIYGKPKSKEELEVWSQLAELNLSLSNLKQSVVSVQESLIEQQQHLKQIKENSEKPVEDITMTEIKSEVSSIKALLLSRHQFPASRVSNPSIPSWQMVENASQNQLTTISVTEIESTGISSITTLTSESNHKTSSEDPETEIKEIETLSETEH